MAFETGYGGNCENGYGGNDGYGQDAYETYAVEDWYQDYWQDYYCADDADESAYYEALDESSEAVAPLANVEVMGKCTADAYAVFFQRRGKGKGKAKGKKGRGKRAVCAVLASF